MTAVDQLAPTVGVFQACEAMGVSRATWYRAHNPQPKSPACFTASPRALSDVERQAVLDALHSPRFADQAPAEVYATLLDEGVYLCSIRTMYRLLHQHQEVQERRDQLQRPAYKKPQLLATAPNQLWSWDITKLRGPAKWTHYHLYVVMDVFSRYVVGWTLAYGENAALARRLIQESIQKQNIPAGQLTIHSDRGPAMKSQTVAQLLATLGVEKSHSRPYVSDDNPFSESLFKTVKYRPEFPERFDSLEDGLAFCRLFFPWYNDEHHHHALALLTPAMVHYGLAAQVQEKRAAVLSAAYAAHPERFVNHAPSPLVLPEAVWINPPTQSEETSPNVQEKSVVATSEPAAFPTPTLSFEGNTQAKPGNPWQAVSAGNTESVLH